MAPVIVEVQLLRDCRVIQAYDTGDEHEYKSFSHESHSHGRLAGVAGRRGLCHGVLHLCNDNQLGFSSDVRKLDMRKFLSVATLSLAALPVIASAHGCVKGAAIGGVVGHVASHHAVAGAAIGCVVGHQRAKEKEKQKKAAQAQVAT